MSEQMAIQKADSNRRLFGGYATVEVVDKQGELVDIQAFKDVIKSFMAMGGNIIDTHTNKTVAKVLDYEFTKKKLDDGAEEDALWFDMECYKEYDYHDKVWEAIKNGDYTGLSMGGRRKKGEFELKCDTGGCHNHVKGIELFEVSIVDKPANQEATIEEVNSMAKGDKPLTFSMICPEGNAEPCPDCTVKNKSVSDLLKPDAFDRCVAHLEDDPEIKSPHAVCQEAVGKRDNGTPSSEEDTTKTGGTQMSEEEKKKKVEETKAEGTPQAEETKKEEPQADPMAEMAERIAAVEQVVAKLVEAKQEPEEEKPETPAAKPEEEEEKEGEITLKTMETLKTSIDEVKKQLDALKAPAPSTDTERPDMKKGTSPVADGEPELDILKVAGELDHRQIAEKFPN